MHARQDVDDAEERGSLPTWFVRAAYVPARSADRAPPALSMLA